MTRSLLYSCCLLLCCWTIPCSAQTVQLPTFRFFGVSTTVEVPDGGSASLGGNTSSFLGSQTNGVPLLGNNPGLSPLARQRAITQGGTASQISVTAQIHDQEALDTALLGMPVEEFRRQVAAGKQANVSVGPRPGQFAGQHGAKPGQANRPGPVLPPGRASLSMTNNAAPLQSLAEIRARQAMPDPARQAKYEQHWELAQGAAARGQTKLALAYYRVAANNANTPEQVAAVSAETAALTGGTQPQVVSASSP
ncbi:MAG: hypothetical protein SFX18_00250 [Pirellulales bacterium]|nr:hypothetical protein [Pirellulales bacterium]